VTQCIVHAHSVGVLEPSGEDWFLFKSADNSGISREARCAPGWFIGNHLENQITNFSQDPLAANSPVRFAEHGPIGSESSPVPAGHRVGSGQVELFIQSGQSRRRATQNSLLSRPSLGLGCGRFRTTSCSRRARFSSTKFCHVRKSEGRHRTRS
jgi:hypothetical protein